MLHSRRIGGTRRGRTARSGGARGNRCQPTGSICGHDTGGYPSAQVPAAGLTYALVHVTRSLGAERAARHSEVASLNRRLRTLELHNASLSSRVGSTERSLQQRDSGIAPLAKPVSRSVFTVETDTGLGTAWADPLWQ